MRGLIQSADLLFQQWQDVHRVIDRVDLVVRSLVSREHLWPATDHDLMDIPPHLNLVVGIGHWYRVVIGSIAHDRDRRGPRTDLLASVIRDRRPRHQSSQVARQSLSDRCAMASHNIVLTRQTLILQPRVQGVETLKARRGHHEVPPPVSIATEARFQHNTALNMTLVIALDRAAKLVVEQVVGLKLGKGPGAFTRTIH